jgi:hypothetical protein
VEDGKGNNCAGDGRKQFTALLSPLTGLNAELPEIVTRKTLVEYLNNSADTCNNLKYESHEIFCSPSEKRIKIPE